MANITDLLRSWQVPEDTLKSFIENGITIELLPKLTEENLRELCPHVGNRILIKEKNSEIITATASTETTSVSNASTLINNNEKIDNVSMITLDGININELIPSNDNICITRTFPNFDLATLLQTTAGGASILIFYKTFGSLNNTKRNQLTDIIVKHIYTYIVNSKITYEEYNILAAKIITLFPTETIGTYYTKPIKKNQSINNRSTTAKGKLVDKVRNLIYKFGDRKRKSSNSENEPLVKKSNDLNLRESNQATLIWLQNNSEPWEEVEKNWRATYVLRREAEYESLHDFLREWKILNDQRSDVLVNIDFELMYPDKGLNFYLNWEDFYKKLLILKTTKEDAILNIINSIDDLDDDLKIPSQISVLAHLGPPIGRLTKKLKFSTQEAIDSIFICAKTAGDIENIISTQKEKAS